MSRSARRPPRRQRAIAGERRIVRVLAEGAVTEAGYLTEWVREHTRTIDLMIDRDAAGCAPLKLVERARQQQRSQRRKSPDFDEIWCVFDVDSHPDVKSAVTEARDVGIEIAVSNPCFELWLVLHVEDRTAAVDRRSIQRRARELGLLDGKSVPASAWPGLVDGYDDAKRRAQALDAMHDGDARTPGSNPSSGVWRLIDSIRGESSPE